MENSKRIKEIGDEIEVINREIFELRERKIKLYLEQNRLCAQATNQESAQSAPSVNDRNHQEIESSRL